MRTKTNRRTAAWAFWAVTAAALAGCAHHDSPAAADGGIPAQGTPAQIQQAIQQDAARQAQAARNMPMPGAAAPAPGR